MKHSRIINWLQRTISVAFLVYEWVITMGEEVNLFWIQKAAVAPRGLFVLNRYTPLVYFLSSFSGSSAMSNTRYAPTLWIAPRHTTLTHPN